MPHQTPLSSRQPGMQNHLRYPQYRNIPLGAPYVGGYDVPHYAPQYYPHNGGNDKSDIRWHSVMQGTVSGNEARKVRTIGSHESDEEAAATALLIAAGGSRLAEQTQKGDTHDAKHDNGTTKDKSQSCNISVNSTDAHENGSLADDASETNGNKSGIEALGTFPAELHKILSESEFSGSVLEWLPSGTAWRVLRWDGLANKVLPTHFPQLCQKETQKEGGNEKESVTSDRINSFLQYIRGWGFQEVKEVGPEMGSFKNEFFIKVAPRLCRYMKQDATTESSAHTTQEETKHIVSPTRSGPSHGISEEEVSQSSAHWALANMRTPSHAQGLFYVSPEKRRTGMSADEEKSTDMYESAASRDRPISPSYMFNGRHPPTGYHLNYVSPSAQPHYIGLNSVRIPDSPYYPGGRKGYSSAPRLRSNRGGARVCRLDRRDEMDKLPPMSTAAQRGFPVSNRGKGRRGNPSRIVAPNLPVGKNTAICSIERNASISSTGSEQKSIVSKCSDAGGPSKKRKLDNYR